MTTDPNIILLGRVGSHAYGLNHADSDEDFLGVFVAPTLDMAGLHWTSDRESIVKIQSHSVEPDRTVHEVGKFMRLCLKANPTVTELLWLDEMDYVWMTGFGAKLIEIRETFLSEKYVRAAYRGYASQQLHKFVESGEWKPKHARHCLRLMRQGVGLLETGHLEVKVSDPQIYWDLAEMAPDDVVDLLKKELDKFDDVIVTPLREKPDDAPAEDLLRIIRSSYL